MIEQLREKYIWKDGFSEMAKSGEEGGQIGRLAEQSDFLILLTCICFVPIFLICILPISYFWFVQCNIWSNIVNVMALLITVFPLSDFLILSTCICFVPIFLICILLISIFWFVQCNIWSNIVNVMVLLITVFPLFGHLGLCKVCSWLLRP